MGTVVLPKLSQSGANEWADVEDNDKALRDEINGNIENVNIKSTAAIAHSKLAAMTAGYVLLGNGSTVPTATAVSGDVTISSSGVTTIGADAVGTTEIAALPVCVLAQTSNVASLNSSVETWASETTDTDTMHSTSANTSRITITTAGVYRVQASCWFDSTLTSSDNCRVEILFNGTAIGKATGPCLDLGGGILTAYAAIDVTFACAATNYFEVIFSQDNAGAASASKRFTATYVTASS